MKKPIGKLLWHKAVRKTASYSAAPDNIGLTVVEIPVKFYDYWIYERDGAVVKKILCAINKQLDRTSLSPVPKGFKVLTKITFDTTKPTTVVICEMQTYRLQDWQWICTAHRYKGGETPDIEFKYYFNP